MGETQLCFDYICSSAAVKTSLYYYFSFQFSITKTKVNKKKFLCAQETKSESTYIKLLILFITQV